MTTTVFVHVEGNKAVSMKVLDAEGMDCGRQPVNPLMPGEIGKTWISDAERVVIQETGDFLDR